MNKYLITGGSGFIGTNLVEYHLNRGDQVINIDNMPPKNSDHTSIWKKCDLLDLTNLKLIINEFSPTHIYHLAARTDLNGDNISDYAANTTGLKNLISCILPLENLEKVIFSSSRLVCKINYPPKDWNDFCPTTAYGESKVEGEKIIQALPETKWSWSIIRPTSIWGPWFGVPYRNFFDTVKNGLYFHPKGKKIYKSFGFVGNSVHELFTLIHADRNLIHKNKFYIGDYEPIEVYNFANMIAKYFHRKNVRSIPLPLLRLPAIFGDIVGRIGINFPLTSFRLDNLNSPMIHDFENLANVVGKLPFSLDEGVKVTVDWMKSDGQK